MGYYIRQMDAAFNLKTKDSEAAALAAIKSYAKAAGPSFASIKKAKTFQEAMAEFYWEVEVDKDALEASGETYTSIVFSGEKAGDQDMVLRIIAPFVAAGSWIEMQGEEGEMWRYYFDGQVMREIEPTITWEMPPKS